jgi:hypothetical protein
MFMMLFILVHWTIGMFRGALHGGPLFDAMLFTIARSLFSMIFPLTVSYALPVWPTGFSLSACAQHPK